MQKPKHGLHELQNCTFMQAGCFGQYIYNKYYIYIDIFFDLYSPTIMCNSAIHAIHPRS